MPEFTSRDLGGVNDKVELRLAGDTLLVAESYDVRMSFFRQPSVFALRTGWGGTTLDLLDKYPPNTPFELLIAGRVQFTGRIDAVNAEQSAGATEVTFHGRDDLAPLHDAMASVERSFDNASYEDIINALLTDAGIEEYTLFFQNNNNRERKTGVAVPTGGTGRKVFGRSAASGTRKKKKNNNLKVGDKLYEYVKKELDKGGLFLFAAARDDSGPVFILTEPNSEQPATYRILRERGQLRNKGNVISASFKNDVSKRFVEYVVHGRTSDTKSGKPPVVATYTDNEMLVLGYPRKRRFSARIDTISSQAEALNFAWRKRADDRREGRVLTYVVSGHTVPALNGRTQNDRAVWCVDTVVEVDDREYGIQESMWLTDVQFQRDGSGTRTTLTMVSADDWVAPS